ncbi:uncharacterized protein TRIVIDRAFT_63603 [Trichoderma virens Gv29-8]|uniref:Uncharacterized protein n=1 Tax=Hypocrea virens (strain Gv29-8 / FGSC 10586) TaxID=413071 RepID=G9MHU4_HYPVG|nr:uncharacterized protein TRIVIDRAFT_63603 [Trichoderma virens Gv29-8]EHK26281.1 hypothetical protein TRIVIDRAFT_63603 [Trichoderma virens Gv29-8]UKZ46464.1 hypothetical protein TrVGV298_000667 [Trichoderma virens]
MSKEAGLKNETRPKALGPHYDYQRVRKSNSQQALENPDWRTRTSDNASSPTLDGEQVWRNVKGPGRNCIAMDTFPTTPSAGESKHEAPPQKSSDVAQDDTTVNSDVRGHQKNVFALSSELEPKIIKTLEEEQPVPYGILKQICLPSSKEHPLSLLEVAPLGSIPSWQSPSVVEIRPLRGNLMQRKPDNGQDEQLTAALKAAEATPHKVRVHVNQQNRQNEMKMKYSTPDELRLRKEIFEGFELPGAIAAQIRRTQDCSSENRLSSNQTARLVNDERPMAAFEAEKAQAFQRFLQKLGQKNRDSPNENPPGRDRVDSYEDGSKEEQSGGSTETCIFRYRTQRADERKQTSSEMLTGYRPRGLETSHKENTSRPGQEYARFKNLNPKAREFLSFVSNRSSNSEDGNMKPLQALTTEAFMSTGGHANAMSLAGLGQPNVSSFEQHPPPYELVRLAAAPDVTAAPLTLNIGNLMPGRLVPVPVATDQFGGQFSTSALPISTMPSLPSLIPSVFRPQSVLQSLSMPGNAIVGFPAVPSMVNTTYPSTLPNSSNPCLSMPSCQMPLMTGASCPPQPVPKPRRPDPGDQQAYEAWIEWRKANEPGYALECRLRQQRRAQRSMTDKAPPKAPPAEKDIRSRPQHVDNVAFKMSFDCFLWVVSPQGYP